MKVILLKDIRGVGMAGDLIAVADGYATNLLFPKKWGVQATPAELAKYKTRKEKEEREIERLKALAKKLSQESLQFTLKTGARGEVFNSVTKDDIAIALKKIGYNDIREIELDKPIRTLGAHTAIVHFHHGIKENVAIIITTVDK